jgi:hypothetical protein
MTYDDVYSPETIRDFNADNIHRALLSLIFGLFCIFLILRYSSKSMEASFRFHLLNITVWTLFTDLYITMLHRFYSVEPIYGGCFPGELAQFLARWMDPELAFAITLVSQTDLDLSGFLKFPFLEHFFLCCWGKRRGGVQRRNPQVFTCFGHGKPKQI